MPNEPEKPIEPALHAYAQQRRKAAGAPLELHPATRHLLQGEVARTLAQPADKTPSRFQLLLTAWPRLAFGGAIFATLVFVMVLMQSGKRVGPGGSMMQLAKHAAKPTAQTEFRKLSESPAPSEMETQDRDAAAPMPATSGLSQPPPKPMTADPSENIHEAKKDSYTRSTPPMPRNFKPAESAVQSREEMVRQDFSFKAKSETAEAKVSGAPAAPTVAGGANSTKKLSRESSVNRQAAEKQLTEARRQLGENMEQPAKPADKIEPADKSQLRMMRTAEPSRPAITDEKKMAKQLAPAAIPEGAAADDGKLMKLAERDVKLGVDKPAAMLAVTPLSAFQQTTPAKRLAIDTAKAATNVVYFYTSGGELRLSFAQEDSRARYRQNLNSPPVPNVLTTFQIERAGNAIRIIDADGSTYAGQIIPAKPSVSLLDADDESVRLPDAAKKESRENSLKKNLAPRTTPALAGSAGKTPAAGFSFQAVGTNQTLNQSVEFFGTLVLDAAELPIAKAKTAAPVPASGPQTNVVLNQAEFPRGRIQGQAVVGGKNRFEINAVPATK